MNYRDIRFFGFYLHEEKGRKNALDVVADEMHDRKLGGAADEDFNKARSRLGADKFDLYLDLSEKARSVHAILESGDDSNVKNAKMLDEFYKGVVVLDFAEKLYVRCSKINADFDLATLASGRQTPHNPTRSLTQRVLDEAGLSRGEVGLETVALKRGGPSAIIALS